MKNLKMRTKITLQIAIVIMICITMLYVIASQSMTGMMKKSELDNMNASLNAQTNIIKQYIDEQETLLTAFSKAFEVRDLLKNPDDGEKQKRALSMYCPVFDEDGKSIIGYVGGGTIADDLKQLLDKSYASTDTSMLYSMKM